MSKKLNKDDVKPWSIIPSSMFSSSLKSINASTFAMH